MKGALLIILDGFGLPENLDESAITPETAPYLYSIRNSYPTCSIKTSGMSVGLPDGQMGNSEVGHINIGAGRVVYQDLSRIQLAIESGVFKSNETLIEAFKHVESNKSSLHLMGLISDGGVHSMASHAIETAKAAFEYGLRKIYIHCFLDGRDTPPNSGLSFIRDLENTLSGIAEIATVSGRYYAMDRDKRWERTKEAYSAITGLGKSMSCKSALSYIEASYQEGVTDEFIKPAQIIKGDGVSHTIASGDSIVFFNFRPDRARQLTSAIMNKGFANFEQADLDNVYFASFTSYDDSFDFAHVAFEDENLESTIGEYISKLNLSQLRIAETEKYAHVTYFFNGGREEPFIGEERILINSPKVATYDLKPEMSVYEVSEALIAKIKLSEYNLIVCNLANCDMVGHTGDMKAAKEAVFHVDKCVKAIVESACEHGYATIITADHGNAEKMAQNGIPFTSHTTFDVPMTVISSEIKELRSGKLSDIAPTILEILGLEKPAKMTGESLAIY